MKRAALISVIAGTALAIAPAASAVVMSVDSVGGGVSGIAQASTIDPAIQAVLLRSQGLAKYDTSSSTMPSAFVGQSDILGGTGATQATSGHSFEVNWNALLPTILAGFLLLGTAWTVVTRRRHQVST